ncbi:MAG TPA: PorV/PorQ family protein [Bacteroidota bacterium]|nr:PorV/PorQ family protein [Bacteroidota bacterium]
MKHIIFHIVLIVAAAQTVICQSILPNLGGQRAGISSLQFLKIGVGGQGSAMEESMAAVANDVSALYWNPAGVVLDESNGAMFAHAEWLVDLKHDFIGAIYHLTSADVVGLSCISLRTDDMPVTTETQPFGNGTYFQYSDLAIGLTYSRKMTSQFSFGATAKYVEEDLAVLKMRTFLFDFGTFYKTGLGSSRIGVVVSNFGSDVAPAGQVTALDGSTISSFQSFTPPTVFKLGFAFEPYQTEQNRITTSVQLNHPNDNAEDIRFGVEYAWSEWLMLRAGLRRTVGGSWLSANSNTADNYSFGIGVVAPLSFTKLTFDYAYTDFGDLGAVHRISCSMTY